MWFLYHEICAHSYFRRRGDLRGVYLFVVEPGWVPLVIPFEMGCCILLTCLVILLLFKF